MNSYTFIDQTDAKTLKVPTKPNMQQTKTKKKIRVTTVNKQSTTRSTSKPKIHKTKVEIVKAGNLHADRVLIKVSIVLAISA